MKSLSKLFGALATAVVLTPSLAAADTSSVTERANLVEERYGKTLGNSTLNSGCIKPSTHENDGYLAYDIAPNTAIVIEDKETIGIRMTFRNNKGRRVCDSSKLHGDIPRFFKRGLSAFGN